MITFSVDDANRILHMVAEGMISEADIDGAVDRLQTQYPQVGLRISGGRAGGDAAMLLDWERLEGWELGAKTVGTLTAKMLSDVFSRVAIVADKKWHDERHRIADVNKGASVRVFVPSQREKALAWLRGE